ncbi:toll/interleukin-1 receptor domain-containing protein [Clavibacter michiganensis subsp. phaseoli]|uniref:toll/interleukin-1 receptor domain-containing protein n=1 Tax=Clavibacter phaseoli TaxID=1734031 RepID=UPI001FB4507C|nr:toll/interleukin-1 receptor domain-containing protein [Clavibacter phaseoli]MCJ1712503.1 toll/interleukin-1 receptor domain-containing protein [Clavibacter phaseoli]
MSYTPQQVRDLEPVRTAAMARTKAHDVFLCHAWPDRRDDALELYELLGAEDVTVWFSEASLTPGTDMRIAIERGLGSSRMGLVLVTPAMLEKLRSDRSMANSELSALLRRNLLIPVLHGVTYEELDTVSSMLASKSGFSTAEEPIEDIATKIAELVGSLASDELVAD